MHAISESDMAFREEFERGLLAPSAFTHRSHLRLAYIHLASYGPGDAASSFKGSLLAYLDHHKIDSSKYHETLTLAWLRAVWHFMQRAGDTTSSEDFMERSSALLDPAIMLTHYTKELLFSAEARHRHIEPDLSPIPTRVDPRDPRAD